MFQCFTDENLFSVLKLDFHNLTFFQNIFNSRSSASCCTLQTSETNNYYICHNLFDFLFLRRSNEPSFVLISPHFLQYGYSYPDFKLLHNSRYLLVQTCKVTCKGRNMIDAVKQYYREKKMSVLIFALNRGHDETMKTLRRKRKCNIISSIDP